MQFCFGFIDAGYIIKGNGWLIAIEYTRTTLAKLHRLVVGALCLAHHKVDETHNKHRWQRVAQQCHDIPPIAGALHVPLDARKAFLRNAQRYKLLSGCGFSLYPGNCDTVRRRRYEIDRKIVLGNRNFLDFLVENCIAHFTQRQNFLCRSLRPH